MFEIYYFWDKDHNGNKYLLLSCAILGIIIYVTLLSVIHVFILLNKVKSNHLFDAFE